MILYSNSKSFLMDANNVFMTVLDGYYIAHGDSVDTLLASISFYRAQDATLAKEQLARHGYVSCTVHGIEINGTDYAFAEYLEVKHSSSWKKVRPGPHPGDPLQETNER